jgi:carbohydrate kinase (thermoresistant glucokinase family)
VASTSPPVIVVMGVSGSGKSTVGQDLADRLHATYQEGDALHPQANVEKMSHGIPLTDSDRRPWLMKIAAVIDGWLDRHEAGVVTCSALKRAYRDLLISQRQGVTLVYLEGSHELIAMRMAARHGHFMPTSLLDSQFATLEPPKDDERPITVHVDAPPEAIADEIVQRLAARQSGESGSGADGS